MRVRGHSDPTSHARGGEAAQSGDTMFALVVLGFLGGLAALMVVLAYLEPALEPAPAAARRPTAGDLR